MVSSGDRPILILGGGINGAAIARELLLNGLPVCLVDMGDLACGATAYSSRLVHGGLRYLEYGELSLVRESLAERTRLLRLAPDFVRPLRLYIPIRSRWGGFRTSVRRMFGAGDGSKKPEPRGLWLIGTGLWMYDLFARDRQLDGRRVHSTQAADVPSVNARYRWFYSFHDAQMLFPERFVLALLQDAERLAQQHNLEFQVLTYHESLLRGDTVEIRSLRHHDKPAAVLQPRSIINATGAWVDATLKRLEVSARRLMGGTKGSHFLTFHEPLREILDGRGIYVEADDGRPVFILPWDQGTLVGTTDEPFSGPPEEARASDAEIAYLLEAVNDLFPSVTLTPDDVALHYAGVRPLPYVDSATPAAVTRRHWLEEHTGSRIPLYSVIGGKLTTCRSLAEQTANTVLSRLGIPLRERSRNRPISGGSGSHHEVHNTAAVTQQHLDPEQIRAIQRLCGRGTHDWLSNLLTTGTASGDERRSVHDTHLPRGFVRNIICREWVTCLSDLVERRLMLLYDQNLTLRCLRELADLLVDCGHCRVADRDAEVARCCERLRDQFGRSVADDANAKQSETRAERDR
jgi:glycerol-3-phosphate dehydrogenase